MTKHNDIVSQWNNANARDFEARLRAAAAETAPRKRGLAVRLLVLAAVCAACFVPAGIVGWANGGFETAHAAPVAARTADPAPATGTATGTATEAAPEAVTVAPVTIVAKAPARKSAAKPRTECGTQALRLSGGSVRVCDVPRTDADGGLWKPADKGALLPDAPWR